MRREETQLDCLVVLKQNYKDIKMQSRIDMCLDRKNCRNQLADLGEGANFMQFSEKMTKSYFGVSLFTRTKIFSSSCSF